MSAAPAHVTNEQKRQAEFDLAFAEKQLKEISDSIATTEASGAFAPRGLLHTQQQLKNEILKCKSIIAG